MGKIFLIGIGLVALIFCGRKPKIDLELEKEKMMQTDRDFSTKSINSNASEAFFNFMTEDAILFSFNPPVIGLEKIKSAMPCDSNFVLSWEPDFAEISGSGDMGYTSGIYLSIQKSDEGKEKQGRGRYLSIWRKQNDGSWKAIADIGTSF
ncbi:MAG: DUF4440 domain-containing protein [Armatimonadetes bacterium]|nr:DUF4440 domain-containing protein [Armatimonadota bacterium]